MHNGIIFRGAFPFIQRKLQILDLAEVHETPAKKSATKASIRRVTWWPGTTQDIQNFVSLSKNCQMNRPSLGRKVSTQPEANVCERFIMDWGYIKDSGNKLIIVDAGSGWLEAFYSGNITWETVKVCLSQIFAGFEKPKKDIRFYIYIYRLG